MPTRFNPKESVLVTGGSGYVATFILMELIKQGYDVKTTLRSMSKIDDVRQNLRSAGVDPSAVQFYEADLRKDYGWAYAIANTDYVIHAASPTPKSNIKDGEIITTAREGTLRVLRASKAAGVKRVILTSSIATLCWGQRNDRLHPLDESDWSDVGVPGAPAVVKSKIASERIAWDYVESHDDAPELVTINPTTIFGPVLGEPTTSSVKIIKDLLTGEIPMLFNVAFGIADVRDVAELHVKALKLPDAASERYIVTSDDHSYYLKEVSLILRECLGEKAKNVPTRTMPNWLARTMRYVVKEMQSTVPFLDFAPNISSKKAQKAFGWRPRLAADAVLATAESLIDRKIVTFRVN